MKYLKALILFLGLFFVNAADARPLHGSGTVAGVGNATLNFSLGDLGAQLPTNMFSLAAISATPGTNSPAALDASGFPVANFSGVIGGQLAPAAQQLSTAGPWLLAWDAGRSCFKINFLTTATVTLTSGSATITNGSGSGNPSITGDCAQAGSVTINWASPAGITYQFDGSYTQWNSNTTGRFYLARSSNSGWSGQSDAIAFQNGIFWTTEAVNFIKVLKPETLRLMGINVQNGNGSTTNVVNWNDRLTTSAISFSFDDYPPGTRCGSAASGPQTFCTISVSNGALTAALATNTPTSGWVGDEQLTGNVASTVGGLAVTGVGSNGGNCQFTVASTTGLTASNPVLIESVSGATECNAHTTILSVDDPTHFTIPVSKTATTYTGNGFVGYQTLTITGKTGGPKIVVNNLVTPIGDVFDTIASGFGTFTYNSTLDLVIYSQGGVANSIPLEAQVQLANLVNANYWYNIPSYANNTFVTNTINTIFSNLNSNLKLVLELDNELWNFQFKNTRFAVEMGGVLGITPRFANNSLPLPWQEVRNRQIFGTLVPASSWSSALSRIDRTYGIQGGVNGTTNAVNSITGADLVSPGNAAYQAYVGGSAVNYNTSPNRPGDFIQSFAIAPYLGGGTALSGQSSDQGNPAPTSFDAALLNNIVSDWNASNFSGSESLIDQSIRGDIQNRVTTFTASGATLTTPSAHNYSQFDILRCSVTGGTVYSNINPLTLYQVLTVPSSTTFTLGQVVAGVTSAAINPGTPGTGTTSCGDLGPGSNGNQYNLLTIYALMSGLHTKWQGMATGGFSPALAGGAPKIRWYEGAPEPSAPSVTQCAAISINSTDCATLATALIGWKNSSFANATMAYYYQTFTGAASGTITTSAMPNAAAPSHLVLQGGGLYGLNSNQAYAASAPTPPAPYQLYNGFCTFSSGSAC